MTELHKTIFDAMCTFFGDDEFVEEMSDEFKACTEFIIRALDDKYDISNK